jgi:type II secretory pathway pseudopilin PulG
MSKPDINLAPVLKRCVTLLETLVALAILIAAGALIFPMMMSSLDERAFESVADVTNEQLMLARAHAQATGSPVEVTFNQATSQVQARLYAPWLMSEPSAAGSFPSVFPGLGSDERATGTLVEKQPASTSREIPESWACQKLGANVRFRTSPPVTAEADGDRNLSEPSLGEDDYESLADLASGQEVRLAVFMPDGSALAGEPVWLNDDQGRCGLFTINPWSGLPVFQRLNQPQTSTEHDAPGRSSDRSSATDSSAASDTSNSSPSGTDAARDDEDDDEYSGPFNF